MRRKIDFLGKGLGFCSKLYYFNVEKYKTHYYKINYNGNKNKQLSLCYKHISIVRSL